MALNLKDEETVALVGEVAARLGLTKTGAVRELARQRLADLDSAARDHAARRQADDIRWLESEVWPRSAGASISTTEIEELLGYEKMTER